jgi:hypothetical protein
MLVFSPCPIQVLIFFYQNVRGLRTRFTELFDNGISSGYNIFCLTETWLKDQCYDQNLFPDGFIVFRSDRIHAKKKRGGGVIMAVSPKFNACKRRHDFHFFDECVWVEFSTHNGPNLLIGNHYFSPDLQPFIICEYFSHLENKLDTTNYRVILSGDFNVPRLDWESGLLCENCQFYSKLRGEAIYTSTCFLGLGQCVDADCRSNMLDLVFSNITDLHITPDLPSYRSALDSPIPLQSTDSPCCLNYFGTG